MIKRLRELTGEKFVFRLVDLNDKMKLSLKRIDDQKIIGFVYKSKQSWSTCNLASLKDDLVINYSIQIGLDLESK